MATFNGSGGGVVAAPNLNVTHEYTIVATIPEIQIGHAIIGPITTDYFSTNPNPPSTSQGNKWAIYYDGVGVGGFQANVAAGIGFNDGNLIAFGSFLPGEFTTVFTATGNTSGIGSTTLNGAVAWFAPTFFQLPDIMAIRMEGTVNYPPLDSTTVNFFDGNFGFAQTGVNSNDILLKVDASSKFSVPDSVPEPSTFILLGLGLFGVAAMRRRRMKK